MSKEEFCERFKAHMISSAPFEKFDDGMTVAEYADEVAPTYYNDPHQCAEGPEECADADMSYWGE